jgi:hypothetical protein
MDNKIIILAILLSVLLYVYYSKIIGITFLLSLLLGLAAEEIINKEENE